MKGQTTIFIWLSGVLTPTIAESTIAVLMRETKDTVPYNYRQLIRSITSKLSLGKIDATKYCEEIIQACRCSCDPAAFQNEICNNLSIRPEVVEIFSTLPEPTYLRLVSDQPISWIEANKSRDAIKKLISQEHIIFTESLNIERLAPDIFYHLVRWANCTMNECMLVDADTQRATSAITHGLSSTIYVYPRRLRHELALRGLIDLETDVLHPGLATRTYS
jgi:hypothetical protein